jgi:hypothetical protein
MTNRPCVPKYPKWCGVGLMRINIWIILGALLALFGITRYWQQEREAQNICAKDLIASVCQSVSGEADTAGPRSRLRPGTAWTKRSDMS